MAEDRTGENGRTYILGGNNENTHVIDAAARGLGTRHVQAAVMAMAAFMAYSLRVNLSVAIVAMVRYNSTNATSPELAQSFDWDEKTQGFVLSSFFWGYFMTQIPAGILTEKFGGHRFLCFAILGSSSLTVVLPQCAYLGGWVLVSINRMFQGICQGFCFPSIFTLLGVWSPPLERSSLSSFSLSAQLLGAVAATPLSGVLCSYYGWPSVFYSFGIVGVATGLVMVFLGADTPAKHRKISKIEKHYIHRSLGGAKVKLRVPWNKVLKSVPVWSAIITMSCQSMVYLTFLTKIPTYLATVLKFNMDDNGILSALPYLVSWLLSFVFSWACDLLTDRGWLTLTTARKFFNSIAHFGAALCLVLMGHAGSAALSVFLLTAFMGVQGASFVGVQANFVDLAPNISGAIFSVGNFVSACFGLTGPIIVGFVVSEAGSAEQWRIVFYLSAAIFVLSNLIFIFCGTAETQWWNRPENYEGKGDRSREEKENPEKSNLTFA